MKIFTMIIILFTITKISYAQMFSDSLYLQLYNFQILKGELKDNDIDKNDLSKNFHIEELVKNTNTKDISIYKFYNLKYEEANTSILVIKTGYYEIYDILCFSFLLNNILDIRKNYSNSISETKTILWIREILKIYDEHCKTDLDNSVLLKQYGIYKYYIPLKNFKSTKSIIE